MGYAVIAGKNQNRKMEFKRTNSDGYMTLSLTGDLIGEERGIDLISVVNDSIDEGYNQGVVDISGVRYINSSGIGVLITILTKFRNKNGELYLLKPSESVQKLLIITKLNAIFNIVDSIEEVRDKISNN